MRRLGCCFIILGLLLAPARGWAANACQVGASEADALIEKFFREQGISTETRAAARTAQAATNHSYEALTLDPAAIGESRQITSTVKILQNANRDLQQAVRESGYSEAFIRQLKAEIPPGKGLMRVVSPEEAENILREGEMGSGYDFGMKPGDVRLGHGKNYIVVRCADCSDIKFVHGELGSSEVNTSRIPASKLEFIVLKPKAAEQEAVVQQGEELLARAENPNMRKTVLTLVERCKQDHANCENSLTALQKMADRSRFRAAQIEAKPVIQENLPEVKGVKFKDSRIIHAFDHRAEFGITDDTPESLAKFKRILEEQVKSPERVIPASIQYKDGNTRQLLAYLKGDRVVVVDAKTKELLTAYRMTPANYDALVKEGRLLTGTAPKVRAQTPYSRDVLTPPPPMPAWRNSVEDPGRLAKAEAVLDRPVTEKEWQAIWKAHNIGTGPPYTAAQIAEKARILRQEGGFSTGRLGDIRKLQESWVTGHMPLTRESSAHDIVDSLSQGVSEDNRYVSIPTPDGQARQAVRIDSVEHYGGETHVTAEIYDAHSHASLVRELYPQEMAGMRISSTAREGLANTGGSVVLDESNRYVSFMLDGDRVAGKIVGIEKSDNGETSYWVQHYSYDAQGRDVLVNNHLTEEQAQTLRFSSSARAHFSHQPEAPAPRFTRLFNGQIRPHSDFNGALGVAEYRPQGPFLDFDGGYALPKQGWKIHVSARPENAQKVAELVLPELRKMGVVHKVVGTVDDYKGGFFEPVTRFGGPNTQVGKFITIYPKNQEQAGMIAKMIDETLTRNHLAGGTHFLPVAGEARVGSSGGVYMRYGEFTGDSDFPSGLLKTDANGYVLDHGGKHVLFNGQSVNVNHLDIFTMDTATKQRLGLMLERAGSIVPDVRGSYKPDWVPDPFNAHP